MTVLTNNACVYLILGAIVRDFSDVNIDDLDKQVVWFQWETIDKKVQKVRHEGQIKNLLDCMAKQWDTFLSHCYIKDAQASYCEKLKGQLGPNKTVVQVDISENYQTYYRDETQAAHWV